MAPNAIESFTVRPVAGLPEGTHTATVKLVNVILVRAMRHLLLTRLTLHKPSQSPSL